MNDIPPPDLYHNAHEAPRKAAQCFERLNLSAVPRHPAAAIAMLFFMLSPGRHPADGGFMGRFWFFSAAIEVNHAWLAAFVRSPDVTNQGDAAGWRRF